MATKTESVPTTVDLAARISISHRYADTSAPWWRQVTACGLTGFARVVHDHGPDYSVPCPECFDHEAGNTSLAFLAFALLATVPVGMVLYMVAGLLGTAFGHGVV